MERQTFAQNMELARRIKEDPARYRTMCAAFITLRAFTDAQLVEYLDGLDGRGRLGGCTERGALLAEAERQCRSHHEFDVSAAYALVSDERTNMAVSRQCGAPCATSN